MASRFFTYILLLLIVLVALPGRVQAQITVVAQPSSVTDFAQHDVSTTLITIDPRTCGITPAPSGGTVGCATYLIQFPEYIPPAFPRDRGQLQITSLGGTSGGITFSVTWAYKECTSSSWTLATGSTHTIFFRDTSVPAPDRCWNVRVGGSITGSNLGTHALSYDLYARYDSNGSGSWEQAEFTIVTQRVTFIAPVVCTLTAGSTMIDFGAAQANVSGSITLAPSSGIRTFSGSQGDPVGSSFNFGTSTVNSNSTSVNLSVSPPPSLTRAGGGSVFYQLRWARRDSPGGPWTEISGNSVTVSPGGDDFVGIRVGGVVTTDLGDSPGHYANSLSLSLACN